MYVVHSRHEHQTVWMGKYVGLNGKLDELAGDFFRAGELKSQRDAFKRKTRMET